MSTHDPLTCVAIPCDPCRVEAERILARIDAEAEVISCARAVIAAENVWREIPGNARTTQVEAANRARDKAATRMEVAVLKLDALAVPAGGPS